MGESRFIKSYPPRLARFVASCCAQREYRYDVVRDLDHGFAKRREKCVKQAHRWYWGQVIKSSPLFLIRRVESIDSKHVAYLLLCYIFALVVFNCWDTMLAEHTANYLQVSTYGNSRLPIDLIYFGLFAIGGGITGAVTAAVGFNRAHPFITNAVITLGPVFIMLSIFIFVAVTNCESQNINTYLLIRCFVLAPTLVLGAVIYQKVCVAR